MILGEHVYLTALDVGNAEIAREWINDPETHRWMLSGHIPLAAGDEVAFFEAARHDALARAAFRFEIHRMGDEALLGVTGLEHVDLLHRHAEAGVFIGPAEERGKGYGADALRTVMRFAFETLGLHSLRICVFAGNTRAHELYRRLGFVETGRDRQSHFLRGAYHDLVRLDLLEDEWRAMQQG